MKIVDSLLKSPILKSFNDIVQREQSLLLENLWEAPKAALMLLTLHSTKKNILILTGSTTHARLLDDLNFFGVESVLDFPSWETLPSEEIAPSPDIVGRRLEILYSLLNKKGPKLILCPLQAVLQKILSPKTLKPLCKEWKVGDEIPFSTLPEHLTKLGYRRSAVAADKGEFAVRGGILDIFPLSSPDPYRIDFFGDTIDQMRTYDPIGQKSIDKVKNFFLSPASELNLLKEESNPALLIDYLGKDTVVIFDDLLALEDHYVALKKIGGMSSKLFLSFDDFFKEISSLQKIFWASERAEELSDVKVTKKVGRSFYTGKEPLQPLSFQIFEREIETKRMLHPFHEISDYFSFSENKAAADEMEILQAIQRMSKSDLELHFISSTESEEKKFQDLIVKEKISLPTRTTFERGYLSSGFVLSDANIALLPMTEFTHRYKTRRQKWRSTYHTPASEFHELQAGDIIVHFHQGIGKYLGLEKRKNHLGHETEFLIIEFAENSKLYVPINQSHLISRYIGSKEEMPTLHALGSKSWQRTKLNAQKAIIGYAEDLLRLSAERAVTGGYTFPVDSEEIVSFESDFPFVETDDQLNAISDIKRDMTTSKAMDRLICGDVGYGKTEVAMRAAFKAVVDGKKQVAVLVPTTVLAMQHYDTFCERMANYPVNIGIVSRFRTAKETKQTLEKVANGSIDILIGTHRIISKDVIFNDLGLIIIDEEQRFGVRAKEHLKALKTGVDCLTLSATPIPRTLYMSLVGAKEISVINTPPQDRLPIKTILAERDAPTIQNAILRELSRDGQAFFIHNRVETIYQVTEEIQKLLPESKIVTGHGQMSADELDSVFHAFKSGSADILIATTIVENGIDIPNANTILIDRSDQFGLADLYQLRGRVGRWNRPAYAYFLTPSKRQLPDIARKRLSALIESSGYGGGMKIAMRDLEIRGAGDILGTEQSGQVSAIGFHLYCKLLKRTIDAMRKKIPASFTETKMEFAYDARLPEDYIYETSLRLEIYHRLGDASAVEEVDAILAEMKDRFGKPPEPVIWLYHLTRLRVFASQHQFSLIKFEKYTFTAEQSKGKTTTKKTLSLPRIKTPIELETYVTSALREAFSLRK